jgi:molecular chaperone DnaJ
VLDGCDVIQWLRHDDRGLRHLTVEIPAGVADGARIKLEGKGEVGPGAGPAGDLHVEIKELPHDHFQRVGDDLHGHLYLSRSEATKGGTVGYDTLLDGTKTIHIPPATSDGWTVRLPNLGVTHLGGVGRGDLLVRVVLYD